MKPLPKPVYLFLLFSSISILSFSQKKQGVNGYFVGASGDTTHGFITLEGKSKISKFTIKPNNKSTESRIVQFDTCKLVSVNKEQYYSWTGPRSAAYIDRFTFEIMNGDSIVTETIPLKLVYEGFPFSLYVFRDKREHFFLGLNNTITELRLVYRYLTDWEKRLYSNVSQMPKYYTNETYKSQFLVIMNNELTQKQIGRITSTTYDKNSLIRLLKVLSTPTAESKYRVGY